jgi:Icc-related predicted phosphoesterase
MRVLIFSDIHNDLRRLEGLVQTPADLYISAGDLVSWERGLPDCGRVLAPLGDKLWVLPGNHETAQQISSLCEQFGFRDFHGNHFETGGYQFAGLGYSNPTPFDTPGEYTEDELTTHLAKFGGLKPLVLVCHAPPLDTPLDDGGGGHFGSRAVRTFIEEQAPEHFFCGHIHEAAGRSARIGATEARNVGKQGYVLKL